VQLLVAHAHTLPPLLGSRDLRSLRVSLDVVISGEKAPLGVDIVQFPVVHAHTSPTGSRDIQSLPVAIILIVLYYLYYNYSKEKARETE
jgi:hypothetical protein